MTTIQPKLREETVKISLSTVALVYLARKLGRLLHVLARSPAKLATITALAAGWSLAHIATWLPIAAALMAGVALAWLAVHYPTSYQHHIAARTRGTLRSLTYRYRWSSALKRCGIIKTWQEAPLLLRTSSTRTYDRLRVRMVSGQKLEDYTNSTDRMAQTFGALSCRTANIPDQPHWLDLTFITQDPFTNEVPPFPPERDVLTHGIPIGRREDGTTWRLKLPGNHILVAGATGSGKSEFLRTVIHGLEDVVDNGTAKIWGFDPAGGMQFAAVQHLFDRFIYGSRPTQFADALEEAVRMMQARQEALRGVAQLHTPSPAQPFYVLIIDEIAGLTAYLTDRKAQQRIAVALALLKSQGRAVGFSIIGALQDPRKAVVPDRGLFTTRIGFRLNEAADSSLIFGAGAPDRGCGCHLISDKTRGVAEVEIDGVTGFTRIRCARDPGSGKQVPPLPELPAEPEITTGIFIA
jgi:S-DNA-T family DNA segregation ATPase FtsK/SpoIIIE